MLALNKIALKVEKVKKVSLYCSMKNVKFYQKLGYAIKGEEFEKRK